MIVVNCIILGRAEAYASKNPVLPSIFDGLGMGLGFAIALTLLGAFREVLGNGSVFGYKFIPSDYNITIFVLAPGAFFVLACLITKNRFDRKKGKKVESECASCGTCSGVACGGAMKQKEEEEA